MKNFFFICIIVCASHFGQADISWPKEARGQVKYYRAGVAYGTCSADLKLNVLPDGTLDHLTANLDHCLTVDRHRLVTPFDLDQTGWVWRNGVGWFQGQISGHVSQEEIELHPWVFGLRFKAIKQGGNILFRIGFEHNEQQLTFAGPVTPVPAGTLPSVPRRRLPTATTRLKGVLP